MCQSVEEDGLWPLGKAAALLLASVELLAGAVDVVVDEEEMVEVEMEVAAGLSKCTVVEGKCVRSCGETGGHTEESEAESASEVAVGSQMVLVLVLVLVKLVLNLVLALVLMPVPVLVRCTGSRSDSAPLRSLGSVLMVAAIDEHALLECTPDDEDDEEEEAECTGAPAITIPCCECDDALCAEDAQLQLVVVVIGNAVEKGAAAPAPDAVPERSRALAPKGPGDGHGELPDAPDGAGDGHRSCSRGDGGGCSMMKRLCGTGLLCGFHDAESAVFTEYATGAGCGCGTGDALPLLPLDSSAILSATMRSLIF